VVRCFNEAVGHDNREGEFKKYHQGGSAATHQSVLSALEDHEYVDSVPTVAEQCIWPDDANHQSRCHVRMQVHREIKRVLICGRPARCKRFLKKIGT
jgi:hypothetical protein